MLSLDPITPTDQKSFDEYIKYFKTKCLGGKSPNGIYIWLEKNRCIFDLEGECKFCW